MNTSAGKISSFAPAIIWSMSILVLMVLPASQFPKVGLSFSASDKVVHAAVFFVLSNLLYLGFARSGWSFWKGIFGAVGLSAIYGGIMEFLQLQFSVGRKFEVLDIIANITGAILSVVFLHFIKIKT